MNTIVLLAALFAAPVEAEKPAEAVSTRTAVVAEVPADVKSALQVFQIPENSADDAEIGTFAPSKPKDGETRTYTIVSGNDGDIFSIDAQTGRISVKNGAPLDFETHPNYRLEVETKAVANQEDDLRKSFAAQLKRSGADAATVAKVLEKISRSVVSIELTNVNEPPVLTSQTWTVRTDVPTGTVFGKLSASDPDQGDRLQFSIPEVNTERFFTVDPDTGEIAVRDPAAMQSAIEELPLRGFVAEFQVTDAAGSSVVAKYPLTFEVPPAPTPVEPVEPAVPEVVATEPTPPVAPEGPLEAVVQEQLEDATAAETASSHVAEDEPATEASGGASFWTILNMFTFLGLLGAGYCLFRYSKSLNRRAGREFTEEQRLAELERSYSAQSDAIELERSQLAELKASLDVREHQLTAKGSKLDALEHQFAEMQGLLQTREQQLAAQSEQLETERAELLETSGLVQAKQAQVESESRRLAEIEADLERQRKELMDRVMQLPESGAAFAHEPIAAIEATEKLVGMAAADLEGEAVQESEEVLELRHRLASMFGVTDSDLARHRSDRHTEYEGIVKADDRELARPRDFYSTEGAASQMTAVTEAPVQAPADHPAGSNEEGNSIDSYMRDLLERQRYRQQFGSTAPIPDPRESSRVATSSTVVRSTDSTVAPAPVAAAPVPDKPVSTTPIHPQDREAVRNDLASLRTVANQAARSAVLAHTKKKFRNHSVIKVSCAATSFVIAGVVLSTSFTSLLGWAAAGIGGIMLVDLAYWAYSMHKSDIGRTQEPDSN